MIAMYIRFPFHMVSVPPSCDVIGHSVLMDNVYKCVLVHWNAWNAWNVQPHYAVNGYEVV